MMPSNYFTDIEYKEKGFSIEIELMSKFLKKYKNCKFLFHTLVDIKMEKIKTVDGFFYLFNTIKYKFF